MLILLVPLGQIYIINLLLSNIARKLERNSVILLIYVLTRLYTCDNIDP